MAMEACATSHHWGRVAMTHGHDVRLIPANYVKPFVKRQKNDFADAAAIAEAARLERIETDIHAMRDVMFRNSAILRSCTFATICRSWASAHNRRSLGPSRSDVRL